MPAPCPGADKLRLKFNGLTMLYNETIANVFQTVDVYKGSVASFRKGVVDNDYIPQKCSYFSRTLIWKTFLITGSLKILTWLSTLKSSRVVYHELTKRKDMAVPWWKLDTDNVYYQSESMSRKSSLKRRTSTKTSVLRVHSIKNSLERVKIEDKDSPLSSNETLNNDHLLQDSLETIIMDVERLFPGEDFYNAANATSLKIKRNLIEILYIWSKCNEHVGYKQGFHEILGLVYMNLYKEAIEIPNTNTMSTKDYEILSLYDINYLSHDLFTILNKFLVLSGITGRFFQDEKQLWASIEQFNVSLMKIDQLIHYNLISKLKILSELWVIRYIRLLLLRELGNDLEVTNLLWDKFVVLAGSDASITALPDVIMYLIVVLLVRIKTELITCDFGEALSLLLHYPINEQLASVNTSKYIRSLYKDAVALYNIRAHDRKLYQYGLQLNASTNPSLLITMSYKGNSVVTGSPRNSDDSSISRSASRSPSISSQDARAEKLAFEKLRLEMRLKKKAQLMMR